MGKDSNEPIGCRFMQGVKTENAKTHKTCPGLKGGKGLPLSIRPGHTIRLEVTKEPLTVHTGFSLHYAMAEALQIPTIHVLSLSKDWVSMFGLRKGRMDTRNLSITADQTKPPMKMIEALPENAWQRDTEDDTVEYAEVSYQPVGWPKAYRYLIKRKREKNTTGQRPFFESLAYSYYAVVTNRTGNVQTLTKVHAKRGTCEKRICQFTNEFLSHLPMSGFCKPGISVVRAVGLQRIALDTGFGIAGAVPKEAYQEDTEMYRADRRQDNKVIAFFITQTPQQLQRSRSDLAQLQAAYFNWFGDIYNWNSVLALVGQSGNLQDILKVMKEVSATMLENTATTMKLIEDYCEFIEPKRKTG